MKFGGKMNDWYFVLIGILGCAAIIGTLVRFSGENQKEANEFIKGIQDINKNVEVIVDSQKKFRDEFDELKQRVNDIQTSGLVKFEGKIMEFETKSHNTTVSLGKEISYLAEQVKSLQHRARLNKPIQVQIVNPIELKRREQKPIGSKGVESLLQKSGVAQ